jgi:hypothetical protein
VPTSQTITSTPRWRCSQHAGRQGWSISAVTEGLALRGRIGACVTAFGREEGSITLLHERTCERQLDILPLVMGVLWPLQAGHWRAMLYVTVSLRFAMTWSFDRFVESRFDPFSPYPARRTLLRCRRCAMVLQ